MPLVGAGSDLDGRGACCGVPGGLEEPRVDGGDSRRTRRAKGFSITTPHPSGPRSSSSY